MIDTPIKKVDTFSRKQIFTLKQPKAFAFAVAILVVFGVAVWAQKNPLSTLFPKPTASPAASARPEVAIIDRDFLEEMIPHESNAVDTSRYFLENSENDELKIFAQTIANDQTKEIWTMLGFYQIWFNASYPGSPRYMTMMPDLTQLSGQELDKAYVRGMIMQHQAAVKMAQAISGRTKLPELRTMATEMSIKKVAELVSLNEWMNKNL